MEEVPTEGKGFLPCTSWLLGIIFGVAKDNDLS
jgi:hypothetical protein